MDTRLSYNWEKRPDDPDELILRNTFLNSNKEHAIAKIQKMNSYSKKKDSNRRISWNTQIISS